MLELDQENSGLRILDVSRCGPTSAALPAPDIEASEYRELESAFRQRGGLVESETLTELLRGRMDQPISRLSRWIVDCDVLHDGNQRRHSRHFDSRSGEEKLQRLHAQGAKAQEVLRLCLSTNWCSL